MFFFYRRKDSLLRNGWNLTTKPEDLRLWHYDNRVHENFTTSNVANYDKKLLFFFFNCLRVLEFFRNFTRQNDCRMQEQRQNEIFLFLLQIFQNFIWKRRYYYSGFVWICLQTPWSRAWRLIMQIMFFSWGWSLLQRTSLKKKTNNIVFCKIFFSHTIMISSAQFLMCCTIFRLKCWKMKKISCVSSDRKITQSLQNKKFFLKRCLWNEQDLWKI